MRGECSKHVDVKKVMKRPQEDNETAFIAPFVRAHPLLLPTPANRRTWILVAAAVRACSAVNAAP
jgi:hypothetical protein